MDRRTVLLGGVGIAFPMFKDINPVRGRSIALVIGDGQLGSINISAASDARKFGDVLRQRFMFDDVRDLTSDSPWPEYRPTSDNVVREIEQLCDDSKSPDTFVLYLNGFGFTKSGRLYAATDDTSTTTDRLFRKSFLERSSLPIDSLLLSLSNMKARKIIVLVDIDRSVNPDDERVFKSDAVLLRKCAELVAKRTGGRVGIMFSCKQGQVSSEYEDGWENTDLFTNYLIDGLVGSAKSSSFDDVAAYVDSRFRRSIDSVVRMNDALVRQKPEIIKCGKGKLDFGDRYDSVDKSYAPPPAEIRLDVLGVPSGATVKVNGVLLSGTIYTAKSTDDYWKGFLVSVSARGFRPFVRMVRLSPGSVSTLRVSMEQMATEPYENIKPKLASRLSDYPALEAYVKSLRSIPAGTFQMGSSVGYDDEKPIHSVTLSAFRLGETPVTVAVWKEYCVARGINLPVAPSWGFVDDHPIVNVSWTHIMGSDGTGGFIAWASDLAGFWLTLPTEAQFEYAARGGQNGLEYPWGNYFDDSKVWSSVSVKRSRTAPVSRLSNIYRNAFALTDMSGNVSQWCFDLYGSYGSSARTDPIGPSSTVKSFQNSCVRGGSWLNDISVGFRCANRYRIHPDSRGNFLGFRLAAGPG
jgi:sulfatase modifying factor 1